MFTHIVTHDPESVEITVVRGYVHGQFVNYSFCPVKCSTNVFISTILLPTDISFNGTFVHFIPYSVSHGI
jgi:hypothetical protein